MHFVQRGTLLIFIILLNQAVFAQLPPTKNDFQSIKPLSNKAPTQKRTQATEICGNNVDDDRNGLVDNLDFACYFKDKTSGCKASRIIWTGSNKGLQWADPETGKEGLVGNMNYTTMNDITWTKNSELYGIGWLYDSLYKIDPYTSIATALTNFPGYHFSNAMTSDQDGNLIIASRSLQLQWHIFKYDLTTHQITVIVDLTPYQLESGGDLVFLNGYLYLTCTNSKMAKINMKTRKVEVFTLINTPNTAPMGMVTLGDGYLYMASMANIYRIDPTTMVVDADPYYTFSDNTYMFGLANYTEFCNAPGCDIRVDIEIESPLPYCTDPGILLKANPTNTMGTLSFEWSAPDGTKASGEIATAKINGMYRLSINSEVAECTVKDSIEIAMIKTPSISLGKDTAICNNIPILLRPDNADGITDYAWSNGSSLASITAVVPGTYWVTSSNICGSSRDTIVVMDGLAPLADLGPDLLICPGSSGIVKNLAFKSRLDQYRWSDNTNADSMLVRPGNSYWLENKNICGIIRDSITIQFKDSCSCFPLFPSVDLGQNQMICSYDSAILYNYNHRNGFRYKWSNSETNERIIARQPGVYWVDVSTYCGTERASIEILNKKDGCLRTIFVPTAFSPNRDLLNDYLKPSVFGIDYLVSFEFSVFNRFGQKVFSTASPHIGWDGTVNGRLQNTGNFTWQCSYEFKGMNKQFEKGIVTLLR